MEVIGTPLVRFNSPLIAHFPGEFNHFKAANDLLF
jgi:hypothetical protein